MARSAKTLKIRTGDTVEVLAGKDRGKRGTVNSVDRNTQRVVVEGVNIVKRHTKARPPATTASAANRQQQPSGGVIEKPAAIHVSNVALVSPASGKPTRVGYRVADDGRKVRVSRRDDVDLDETKGK
ncbi:MAG: rplX [Thermoleophilia bacterium]|nr:rplX [Thermoleophilia bacterium]